MNSRNGLLIKGGLAIIVLWLAVGGITKLAGTFKPSPEKIEAYAKNHSLDEIKDPEQRKKVIGRIAEMMNQLEPEDLRKLEEKTSRETRRAMFSSMTPEEQWYFMERRMGRAFSQMMGVFNEMERDERKQMVERALTQIQKNEGQGPIGDADPEMVEQIANAGLKAYFEESSAETKMDLAPLMEEIQKMMSTPGRGHRSKGK